MTLINKASLILLTTNLGKCRQFFAGSARKFDCFQQFHYCQIYSMAETMDLVIFINVHMILLSTISDEVGDE